jgi:hypothetical protein
MYNDSEVFIIKPGKDGRAISRLITAKAHGYAVNSSSYYIPSLSLTAAVDSSFSFHLVGASIAFNFSPSINNFTVNRNINFICKDKNGNVLANETLLNCDKRTMIYIDNAKGATKVESITDPIDPSLNHYFYAGWVGSLNIASSTKNLFVATENTLGTNENLSTNLSAVNLQWLPICGELSTVTATIPGHTITTSNTPDRFVSCIILFVQSTTLPVFSY